MANMKSILVSAASAAVLMMLLLVQLSAANPIYTKEQRLKPTPATVARPSSVWDKVRIRYRPEDLTQLTPDMLPESLAQGGNGVRIQALTPGASMDRWRYALEEAAAAGEVSSESFDSIRHYLAELDKFVTLSGRPRYANIIRLCM